MAVQGKEIHRSHDQYGPIQVFDDGNKRYLAFGNNDEQSCQLKTNPAHLQYDYTRAMLLPLLFKPDPKKILLLGLGGGSLANCLHHHNPQTVITAVELRQQVIDIAYRYFQLPHNKKLTTIQADAADYLRDKEPNDFDLIFSDIYGPTGLDELQLQERYIDQCYHCLNDHGWLILNYWSEHRGKNETLNLLRTRFSQVKTSSTQTGNWVILASRQPQHTSNKQLQDRARQWSKRLGFSLQSPLSKLQEVTT